MKSIPTAVLEIHTQDDIHLFHYPTNISEEAFYKIMNIWVFDLGLRDSEARSTAPIKISSRVREVLCRAYGATDDFQLACHNILVNARKKHKKK